MVRTVGSNSKVAECCENAAHGASCLKFPRQVSQVFQRWRKDTEHRISESRRAASMLSSQPTYRELVEST